MSVTLDTNIYISAFEFGGIGARLIGLARAGLLEVDISDAILDELVSVLGEDFHWEGYRLHFLRQELRKWTRHIIPESAIDLLKEDPPDNRILECAVAAGSECIVTHDQDLLRVGEYAGIRILTAAQFLRLDRSR